MTRLAVVVPTNRAWPEVRPCLDALLPQAAAAGAVVIVADGDGRGVPHELLVQHPDVLRVVCRPGASVFELRALAVGSVDPGIDVVGITEDHCVPAPDWCSRLLDGYDRNADVLGIAGAVTNGSERRLIDRANYFVTFAAAAPPVDTAALRFPPVSNVSFRIAAVPSDLAPGFLELRLGPRLLAEGRMLVDDGLLVCHVQSHGFVGTIAAHFHNGRSSTGLATQGEPWHERRRRLRQQLGIPRRRMRSIRNALRTKPEERRAAMPSLPLIALLCLCHTVGAIVGLLLGQGASPRKLA